MCGQSAKRDRQVESSWSRDDHEDGGPTIQLPAAEPAAPLASVYLQSQYIRRRMPLTKGCDPALPRELELSGDVPIAVEN